MLFLLAIFITLFVIVTLTVDYNDYTEKMSLFRSSIRGTQTVEGFYDINMLNKILGDGDECSDDTNL